jgi:phenylalanyl-tRNA synthetase beta chain
MKVPLNWLREYVSLTVSVPALVERLTIAGLEVASVRLFGLPTPEGLRVKQEERGPVWDRDKVVTARVLSVEKHPNADKLKLVQLDYAAGAPKQVVTGAPNIALGDKGQKVVLGLSGCSYFDGHVAPKAIKELKPSVLRGVPSDAMVMSTFELGIDEEHEGIILLEDDAPVGKPLVDFMGDVVLEIDVLPNMARCLSLIGVAREVAALTGQTASIKNPEVAHSDVPCQGQVNVEIADAKLCARYAAMLIRNVSIKPSPGWMQRRLAYAGMRPKNNNIVDITNYVMLEYGQPLHAFDYDVLVKRAGGNAPTIIVRPAKTGEKLKTLDGAERELTPENLIIADTAGPIALAGVMGGTETEVHAGTRNVLLEAANFDFVSIRRTSKQFTLFSEASTRFSRGIHPEVVKPAALRAAQLMQHHSGGEVLSGMVERYPAPLPVQTIALKKSEIKRLLGIEFADAEVERVLQALDFTVVKDGSSGWKVNVPPYRIDIQAGQADLIEELARVHGYDRLPSTLLSGELPPQRANRPLVLEERVKDVLIASGLQEVITYSLTAPEREAPLGIAGQYVEVLNPISADRKVMRRSVLAGVLEVAKHNLLSTDMVRLFEVGPVYVPVAGEKLPAEPRRLAVVLTGRRKLPAWDDALGAKPEAIDFFDLKGVVEALTGDLHLPSPTYAPAPDASFLHPGRAARLQVAGQSVGCFGEMHPKVAQALGLGERAILVADLDLEALLAQVPDRFPYVPVPRFPAALRDIAVIVEEAIANERITAEMQAAGGSLLGGVRLFDLYRGEPIPAGHKSLAFALTYQADDRTLSDKEIEKAHKKIEDRLRHVLKAKIRGKDE